MTPHTPANTLTTAPRAGAGALGLLAVAMAATLLALVARSLATETAQFAPGAFLRGGFWLALVVAAAGWCWMLAFGGRLLRGFRNQDLAMIGLVSAWHFAASFVSQLAGAALYAVLGPFSVFLAGWGDAGLLCLLKAVLVVLLPRPGALTLSLLTVMTLNVVFTGTLGLVPLMFISISVVFHEGLAAMAGVTTGPALKQPAADAPWSAVARVALAVGLANGLTLASQYFVYAMLFRLQFPWWYIAASAGLAGVGYGAVGAAAGAGIGYRLRRTSP